MTIPYWVAISMLEGRRRRTGGRRMPARKRRRRPTRRQRMVKTPRMSELGWSKGLSLLLLALNDFCCMICCKYYMLNLYE
jgi:hypothetical protein